MLNFGISRFLIGNAAAAAAILLLPVFDIRQSSNRAIHAVMVCLLPPLFQIKKCRNQVSSHFPGHDSFRNHLHFKFMLLWLYIYIWLVADWLAAQLYHLFMFLLEY